MPTTMAEVQEDIRQLKRGLRDIGIPTGLVTSIETRALRSGRRQTGEFKSNRESRWRLQPDDPQYGTDIDSKIILAKLLCQLLEFQGAPIPTNAVLEVARKYLERAPGQGQYRDPLTREHLSFPQIVAEKADPRHGISSFHIGHDDPTRQPKHTPANVSWRSARSNLIQGNLTLREARTKFVELIARYFELGEVSIEPEDGQDGSSLGD